MYTLCLVPKFTKKSFSPQKNKIQIENHNTTHHQKWGKFNCPSMDEWIKYVHIHTIEYYSALKRKIPYYIYKTDEPWYTK